MRGASAKSLTSVLTSVDEVVAGGADPHVLGDGLFAVVGLLDAQPALRRVFTDPSTEAPARRQLVARVLADRIESSTLEVLNIAVEGRWSSARDLADGLERAGVAAHVAGADRSGSLDDVEDELFRFGRTVAGDSELRSVLTDRRAPVDSKRSLVERLLSGKALQPTLALARQAVAARTKGFENTLTEFAELVAQRRESLVATARVAAPIEDDEKRRLAAALTRKYGRDVHVNVVVDPTVIGGVVVELGEDVIDGTVATRLEDARRRIAG